MSKRATTKAKARQMTRTVRLPEPQQDTASVLVLVVEFDEVCGDDELDEILNAANSYGTVTVADLSVLAPSKRSLLPLL